MSSTLSRTRQKRWRTEDCRKAISGGAGHGDFCKGWQQEAALRMLMNNLDPEVAEKPEELVVYGERGRRRGIGNVFMRLCDR